MAIAAAEMAEMAGATATATTILRAHAAVRERTGKTRRDRKADRVPRRIATSIGATATAGMIAAATGMIATAGEIAAATVMTAMAGVTAATGMTAIVGAMAATGETMPTEGGTATAGRA